MAMEPPSIENCAINVSYPALIIGLNWRAHIPKGGTRDRSCRDLVLQLSPSPVSPSDRSKAQVQATKKVQ